MFAINFKAVALIVAMVGAATPKATSSATMPHDDAASARPAAVRSANTVLFTCDIKNEDKESAASFRVLVRRKETGQVVLRQDCWGLGQRWGDWTTHHTGSRRMFFPRGRYQMVISIDRGRNVDANAAFAFWYGGRCIQTPILYFDENLVNGRCEYIHEFNL